MSNITINENYISLSVKPQGLPGRIEIRESFLEVKSSFHVSLLSIRNLVAKYGQEIYPAIKEEFRAYVQDHRISLGGYRNEFRFAENEEGRQTLIVMVDVTNLEDFFDHLRKKFDIEFESQPTHVTLYTLELDQGIAISDTEDLMHLTTDVTDEVADEIKNALGLSA